MEIVLLGWGWKFLFAQLAVGSQFPRLLASDQINQGGWFKLSHQTLSVKSLGLIKKSVLDSNRCKIILTSSQTSYHTSKLPQLYLSRQSWSFEFDPHLSFKLILLSNDQGFPIPMLSHLDFPGRHSS